MRTGSGVRSGDRPIYLWRSLWSPRLVSIKKMRTTTMAQQNEIHSLRTTTSSNCHCNHSLPQHRQLSFLLWSHIHMSRLHSLLRIWYNSCKNRFRRGTRHFLRRRRSRYLSVDSGCQYHRGLLPGLLPATLYTAVSKNRLCVIQVSCYTIRVSFIYSDTAKYKDI